MAKRSTIPTVPRRAEFSPTVADFLSRAAQAHSAIGGLDGETQPEPGAAIPPIPWAEAAPGSPVKQTHTRKRSK